MGLSPLGERVDSWLGLSPSKEKRNKTVVGNSSLLVVGNLEGEEQVVFEDEHFHFDRLKFFFLWSLCALGYYDP